MLSQDPPGRYEITSAPQFPIRKKARPEDGERMSERGGAVVSLAEAGRVNSLSNGSLDRGNDHVLC